MWLLPAPDEHAPGRAIRRELDLEGVACRRERPARVRQRPAGCGVPVYCAQPADHALHVAQTVALIRHVQHGLGAGQFAPVELERDRAAGLGGTCARRDLVTDEVHLAAEVHEGRVRDVGRDRAEHVPL